MRKMAIFLIKTYQWIGGLFFSSPCRFYPTCSEYAIEAIQKYGLKGVVMACIRILKCTPFSRGGYNPVK